ncbi:MAG: hypothetical protein ACTS8S_07625 [Giesbergeria sp.]
MADIRLVFSKPPVATPGAVRLVFGDDAAPAIPDATLDGGGRITGLRLRISMRSGVLLAGAGRITGLRLRIGVQFDINVSRPTVGGVHATWQDAALVQHALRSQWQQSAVLPAGTRTKWQDAERAAAALLARWSDTDRRNTTTAVRYEDARRVPAAPVRSRFQETERRTSAVATQFQEAVRLPAPPLAVRFQEMLHDRQARVGSRFQVAITYRQSVSSGMGVAVRVQRHLGGRYQEAWGPRPGQWVRPPLPQPEPCYLPTLPARLVFKGAYDPVLPARLVFICERAGPPDPGGTVVVPFRRVSIVLNTITLHRVDTGAQLRAHAFSASLDFGSWTWSWSASLHHDAQGLLGRDSAGDTAELHAVINGVPLRLRLESVELDERFLPQKRWAVSGQGKSSILGDSRAPILSFGNAVDRTAQQLASDALTINGVGIGWSLDWGIADWLVPAGAWALQGRYIDAINDIAAAAGGYVQPHPTDAVLRVLPRYPVPPWEWGSVTPDFEIPRGAAEVVGTKFVDKPAYNGVYVGGESVGVFGPFKRTGTDGATLAPQVTHPLITHADAHRARSIAEISDTGSQEHITISMQVLPATGLIVPGQFVRYVGDRTVVGIVRRTAIDLNRPKLRQTIAIETHVAD